MTVVGRPAPVTAMAAGAIGFCPGLVGFVRVWSFPGRNLARVYGAANGVARRTCGPVPVNGATAREGRLTGVSDYSYIDGDTRDLDYICCVTP
ncbi:hypothetical protein PSAC2689_40333 [Paraburkholderia sacchari]